MIFMSKATIGSKIFISQVWKKGLPGWEDWLCAYDEYTVVNSSHENSDCLLNKYD